jgi:ribosomal protein S18 acetylase RimI-like enzyme
MQVISSPDQVLKLVEQVKMGATAYQTNFYASQPKLQSWVAHGELFARSCPDAAFLLRSDHDFYHLYFCAASAPALAAALDAWPERNTLRLSVDLVGREPELQKPIAQWEDKGFARYRQLLRMTRAQQPGATTAGSVQAVTVGTRKDAVEVLTLLRASFDPFAEQLPTEYEIVAALDSQQILLVRMEDSLAGLLFFETQGFASMLRYWVVAKAFQSRGVGAALMTRYLESQSAAKRFVLWVMSDNARAIQQYRRFGYQPDGMVDYVLANVKIAQ